VGLRILQNDFVQRWPSYSYTMTSLYQRLGTWLRNLSRVKYALIMGVIGFVTYLGIGILFNESVFIQAVAMGFTLGGVYYFIDPR